MKQYYKLLEEYQSVITPGEMSFHEYIALKTKYSEIFTKWTIKLLSPFINRDAVFLNMLEVATNFSFEKDASSATLHRALLIGHMTKDYFNDTTAKLISSYEPSHALMLIDMFPLIQNIAHLQLDTWKEILEISDKLSENFIRNQDPEEQPYYRVHWQSSRAPVLEYIRQTS